MRALGPVQIDVMAVWGGVRVGQGLHHCPGVLIPLSANQIGTEQCVENGLCDEFG